MKILALDAVTEACSAALWIDGEIQQRYAVAPREHTRLILPMVDELLHTTDLKLTDLDFIAFDQGPGSFTGIRVTMSVLQGLAFAARLPVLGISSLAALAQSAYRIHGAQQVLSLIDARMNELYWGIYRQQDGVMQLQDRESVAPLAAIPFCENCQLIGSGVSACTNELRQAGYSRLIEDELLRYPRAEYIVELAAASAERAMAVELAEPVYLRNKVTG
ncbi:tRNA (adenosine(37)-N6)-threonylcarbamoyltransferase complex dimerization subunit type 1 TsaB [Thiohalophilus sp.]|uniref:tRNA (adenosine(37)-N6)-threonylcarbamoyltransferase complex dimerization subunit type 1 TsaB n=1 Tax=Thiohalophilus sp. TaxID=3028392 RepID=UPI003974C29C